MQSQTPRVLILIVIVVDGSSFLTRDVGTFKYNTYDCHISQVQITTYVTDDMFMIKTTMTERYSAKLMLTTSLN